MKGAPTPKTLARSRNIPTSIANYFDKIIVDSDGQVFCSDPGTGNVVVARRASDQKFFLIPDYQLNSELLACVTEFGRQDDCLAIPQGNGEDYGENTLYPNGQFEPFDGSVETYTLTDGTLNPEPSFY